MRTRTRKQITVLIVLGALLLFDLAIIFAPGPRVASAHPNTGEQVNISDHYDSVSPGDSFSARATFSGVPCRHVDSDQGQPDSAGADTEIEPVPEVECDENDLLPANISYRFDLLRAPPGRAVADANSCEEGALGTDISDGIRQGLWEDPIYLPAEHLSVNENCRPGPYKLRFTVSYDAPHTAERQTITAVDVDITVTADARIDVDMQTSMQAGTPHDVTLKFHSLRHDLSYEYRALVIAPDKIHTPACEGPGLGGRDTWYTLPNPPDDIPVIHGQIAAACPPGHYWLSVEIRSVGQRKPWKISGLREFDVIAAPTATPTDTPTPPPTATPTATATPDDSGGASDRAVLVALYNATEGAGWSDNSNWLTDAPVGRWHGVTMNRSGRVERLHLPSNNLRGTLPAALGQLSDLKSLNLENNNLHGSIPSELGNLSRLEKLNLSLNNLSGTVPSQLGGLSKLVTLKLSTNALSGAVPSQLGNLARLVELSLSYNELTGSLPSELGNISNLKSLFISDNQLNGSIPRQLGKLSKLKHLYLYNNVLTGAIPLQLGSLAVLEDLRLSNNQLSGSIPRQLGRLKRLKHLYLSTNALTGAIPLQLGSLTALEYLYLSGNRLSGCIPEALRNVGDNDLASLGLEYCVPTATATPVPPRATAPAPKSGPTATATATPRVAFQKGGTATPTAPASKSRPTATPALQTDTTATPTATATPVPSPTADPPTTTPVSSQPAATATPVPSPTADPLTATPVSSQPAATATPTATATSAPAPKKKAVVAAPAPLAIALPAIMSVRSGPGLDYDELLTVPAGTRARIIAIAPDDHWYQVQIDGLNGPVWIEQAQTTLVGSLDGINRFTPQEIALLPRTGAAAPRAISVPAVLNVRSGPGLDYDVLQTVPAGTQARIVAIDPTNDWYQVQIDGLNGLAWIYQDLTTLAGSLDGIRRFTPQEIALLPGVSPLAITLPATLNVRSGPGLDYDVLQTVPAGTQARIVAIGPTGDWFQIELEGLDTLAWAWQDLTTITGSLENVRRITAEEIALLPAAITQPQIMNARSGPGLHYEVVTTLPQGLWTRITAVGSRGEWYRVELDRLDQPAWLFRGLTKVAGGSLADLVRIAVEDSAPPSPVTYEQLTGSITVDLALRQAGGADLEVSWTDNSACTRLYHLYHRNSPDSNTYISLEAAVTASTAHARSLSFSRLSGPSFISAWCGTRRSGRMLAEVEIDPGAAGTYSAPPPIGERLSLAPHADNGPTRMAGEPPANLVRIAVEDSTPPSPVTDEQLTGSITVDLALRQAGGTDLEVSWTDNTACTQLYHLYHRNSPDSTTYTSLEAAVTASTAHARSLSFSRLSGPSFISAWCGTRHTGRMVAEVEIDPDVAGTYSAPPPIGERLALTPHTDNSTR